MAALRRCILFLSSLFFSHTHARTHKHTHTNIHNDQVPCHHEDEVIEVFNELVVKRNVTDHTGELCHVDEHHIHERLEGDNHTATEKSNTSDSDDHEEVSEFCVDVYFVTRDLLLQLNYTVESCLVNGTLGEAGTEETDVPSRLDYGTGAHK